MKLSLKTVSPSNWAVAKAGKKLFGGPEDIGASDAETLSLGMARDQWADYQKRFIPLENKFIDMVHKKPWQYERARGMAGADIAQAAAPNSRLLATSSPNSGASIMDFADNTAAYGTSLSRATNDVTNSVTNQHYAGLMKAVNLGRGIADSADLGIRNAAAASSEQALAQARAQNTERAGLYNAIGSGVGTYAGYRFGGTGQTTPTTTQPVQPPK